MTQAKCNKEGCGYEWETKSEMLFVICPSCRKQVKIRDRRETNEQQQSQQTEQPAQ